MLTLNSTFSHFSPGPASTTTRRPPTTIAAPTTTTTRRPRPTQSTTPSQNYFTDAPTTTTTQRPSNGNGRDCEHGQYYAYPGSCTSFLICVNGKLVTQQCGPGLNWNEAKNMCDWAFKNPCKDDKNDDMKQKLEAEVSL